MADSDLELLGGGGGRGTAWFCFVLLLLALPAFLPSVISFLFTQNKGRAWALLPFPRFATEIEFLLFIVTRVCSDRPADHKEAFNVTEPQNDQCVSFSH